LVLVLNCGRLQAVALRLVRKVAGSTDAASKFKSMQANARVIKNYRHKLLDAMKASVKAAFERQLEDCQGDFLGLIEELGWIYKDIIRIKDDVDPLFPSDYEIAPFLVKAYHTSLNDTLRKVVDAAPEAKALLELHAWIKEYRVSMKELEIPSAWLQPALLDGKSQDLIEDYVKLIVSKLDEWTTNLMREETTKFQWRTREPEEGQDGLFGMEGVVDFFQLVNQQCDLALDSNQGAVLARVVTESAKVMRRVQQEWLSVVAEEARLQAEKKPEEVPGGLVEYVIALANDQLKSADHAEALSARLEQLVSEKYKAVISARLNEAIDGYLDVAKRCTSSLIEFVFNDLRPVTKELITSTWYSGQIMPQIVETMRDYMNDYQAHLNPSIFEILLEDLLDALLISYLNALRRAPSRALRMPVAIQRIKGDISMAFDFFAQYKRPEDLEVNFEVMDQVVSMLSAGSQMVFMDYWSFAKKHGPQLAFVEAIMKARDDFDRVVVQDIMDTLRRKVREEGITDPPEPTIMVGRAWCLDLPRLLADSRTFAEPSHRAIHQTTRTATQHQPRQHLQPRRDICWATARLRREGQGHERPAPRQAVTGRRYHCHSFVVSIYAATRHPNA
jgi:exocyst complex component 3